MLAATILSSPCATVIDTGENIPMTVTHRTWAPGTALADIEAGAAASEAVLTSDGRHYSPLGWHEGPEAEWVYVERWTADGRTFHGWVDSASRRLVQAG